jgi:hypothetical protein
MTRTIVDNVHFVRTWMTQETLKKVADKLGISDASASASAKAANLRAKGVNLPRKQSGAVVSVDELNAIIDKYNEE